MKLTTRIMLLSVVLLTALPACKKKEDPAPAPTGSGTPAPPPTPDAELRTSRHLNAAQSPPLSITSASAIFFSDDNLVQAGDVAVNGTNVPWDLLWYHISSLDSDFSIDGDQVIWTVTGGNGFTPFAHDWDSAFPFLGGLNSNTEIDKSEGYTLSVSDVVDADSVTFSLGYTLTRTVAGNITSYTFTPEDISGMPTGSASVGVYAKRYTEMVHEGKRLRFIKERSTSNWFTVVE